MPMLDELPLHHHTCAKDNTVLLKNNFSNKDNARDVAAIDAYAAMTTSQFRAPIAIS